MILNPGDISVWYEAMAPQDNMNEVGTTSNPMVGRFSEEKQARGLVAVRKSYRHEKCGAVTTLSQAIAEPYSGVPNFYGMAFCCKCTSHFPIGPKGEFVWNGTTEKVGT